MDKSMTKFHIVWSAFKPVNMNHKPAKIASQGGRYIYMLYIVRKSTTKAQVDGIEETTSRRPTTMRLPKNGDALMDHEELSPQNSAWTTSTMMMSTPTA